METIRAGKQFLELIKLGYAANRPVLISGRHGVGKSELIEHAAAEMGIGFICRDLSLMEPPDLIGLPKMNGEATVYLPPAFLPKSGKGLLVFEELNRCEKFMRAPCLQLLTTRRLNDYRLPDGWLPVAAINPSDEEYEVSELDPALLSRFVQVNVVPDQLEWLAWARQAGVHPGVIRYVESDSSVFDNPESNPRAWSYVSDIVKAAQRQRASSETLRAAVIGLVGSARGAAFLRTLKHADRPLTAAEILGSYDKRRGDVQRWIEDGRMDLLERSLQALLKALQPKADYESERASRSHWSRVGHFFADLPGDLQQQAEKFFKGRKYAYPMQKAQTA